MTPLTPPVLHPCKRLRCYSNVGRDGVLRDNQFKTRVGGQEVLEPLVRAELLQLSYTHARLSVVMNNITLTDLPGFVESL